MYAKKLIFWAALAILSACQVKVENPIQDESAIENHGQTKLTAPDITAVQEGGSPTKTILEVDGSGVGTIYWKPADEINVFYGTTSTHYISQNAVNATTAVFSTTDIIGSTESASENIWGLYPYNSSAICTGSAVNTTLPATQYGVPGTFDDDLFITLAHNTSKELAFYNVCGGIKFSLSRDDITSITFRGNNDEDLAGDFSLSFVEDVPSVSVTSGIKTVTLTPKTGSAFASGEDYYLILRPVTLSNGFTMCFTTSSGKNGVFNYSSSSITIKRSVFAKKANIDSYAIFPAPNNQIWYTSTDGEVVTPHLSYAFGANIISNTYSDGKGILEFDDAVTSIASYAFQDCTTLRTIAFPESITTIGAVFSNNPNLISVLFPEGVTSIGPIFNIGAEYVELPTSLLSFGGFSGCTNLKEIILPNSCTTLSGIAGGCINVERIRIPEGVTDIPSLSFRDCESITEIKLPDTLETLGSSAFSGCSELLSITIPNGVTSLGLNTFADCTSLSSVTLHDDITTIGQNAFYNCSSLTSITLPSNLSSLGQSAFESCTSLNDIYIQASFTAGYKSFYYCPIGRKYYVDDLAVWLNITGLHELAATDRYRLFVNNSELTSLVCKNLPGGTSLSSGCFRDCSSISSVSFTGSGITAVPNRAFAGCRNLSSVTLYGVSSIGEQAFSSCNLSSIEIVSSITSIGDRAFEFNPFADYLGINVYPSTPPTIGAQVFTGSTSIYIYTNYDDYYAAPSWAPYRSRLIDESYSD